jgi:hypothetical protein
MATSAGRAELGQAFDPYVLAVDIGSTASRGDVFDAADARSRANGRRLQFTTRDNGTSEIDPEYGPGCRTMAAAVTSAPDPTGLVRRSSIPVHAAVDVPAAVTPRLASCPM